jgi:glutamyl-tRNA synthetase
MYSKKCRKLSSEEAKERVKREPHVIRMKIPADQTIVVNDAIRGPIEFDSNIVDDQVILKSDGFPTYHLSVVVDDHLMKISHPLRGEEWISSAPKHVLLYQYLGWDVPTYIHSPLLRNPDKSKLSKRHGHSSLEWYIDQGYLTEAVLNFLITRVWNHPENKEIIGIDEMIKHFEFKDMHIHGPIVDLDKLDWINGQWIRRLSDDELIARIKTFAPKNLSQTVLKQVLPHIKERLVKLSEIDELTQYFITSPKQDPKQLIKLSKMDNSATASYLTKVVNTLNGVSNWQASKLEAKLRQIQEQENLKPRPAFMTIRLAVTGRTATPPLFDVMEILGKDEVISRLENATNVLKS